MYRTEEEQEKSYYLLGKFSVSFQQMIDEMQELIKETFNINGLNETDLINIFFVEMSAMSILTIFRSLFNQVFQPIPDDKKITERVFSDIEKIIVFRNDIQHGFLYVGSTYEDENGDFPAFRIKRNKNGVYFTHEKLNNELLNEKIDELTKIRLNLIKIQTYYFTKLASSETFKQFNGMDFKGV